jgi:DnaJ-domain-containing protein 1
MALTRSAALALLGVDATADAEELTRAYHRLAREVHPDRCGSADAAEQFLRLREAYQLAAASAAEPSTPAAPDASEKDVGASEEELRDKDTVLSDSPYLTDHRAWSRQPPIVAGPVSVTRPGARRR